MMNYNILHLFHHSVESALHNHKVILQSLQSLPCFLFLLLSLFQLLVESHGVFDPTRALHYFSPIGACGVQTPGDQSSAQCALVHIILYFKDVPTLRKVAEFFFHRTASHLLLSWLMHEPALLTVFPWNPHALKNLFNSHPFLIIIKCKDKVVSNITYLGRVYSSLNTPWCSILDKHAC